MLDNEAVYLLSSLIKLIDTNGDEIYLSGFKTDNITRDKITKIPFNYFIGNSTFPGCTMCIRKEVRDFLNAHEELELNLSLGHDWYFSIIAAALGGFYLLNKALIKRRIHDSNISLGRLRKKTILTTTNEKRNASFLEIIEAHQFILDNNIFSGKLTKSEKIKRKKLLLFLITEFNLLNPGIFFVKTNQNLPGQAGER